MEKHMVLNFPYYPWLLLKIKKKNLQFYIKKKLRKFFLIKIFLGNFKNLQK